MSRPNNHRPNDQQRESQDFQAKAGEAVKQPTEPVFSKEAVKPVASVQRKELL